MVIAVQDESSKSLNIIKLIPNRSKKETISSSLEKEEKEKISTVSNLVQPLGLL